MTVEPSWLGYSWGAEEPCRYWSKRCNFWERLCLSKLLSLWLFFFSQGSVLSSSPKISSLKRIPSSALTSHNLTRCHYSLANADWWRAGRSLQRLEQLDRTWAGTLGRILLVTTSRPSTSWSRRSRRLSTWIMDSGCTSAERLTLSSTPSPSSLLLLVALSGAGLSLRWLSQWNYVDFLMQSLVVF